MTQATVSNPGRGSAVDRFPALLVLAIAPVVTLLSAAPATAARALTTAPGAADPTAPLLAAVALVAWACTGWLLLVVVTTWGGHLPGIAGRWVRRTAQRLAPASVRAFVRVAVGVSVATGVVGAPQAAFAAPVSPVPHAISFDWPGTAAAPLTVVFGPAVPPGPVPGHPTPPPGRPSAGPSHTLPSHIGPSRAAQGAAADGSAVPSVAAPTVPTGQPGAGRPAGVAARDVVVHSGDSLWSLAEAHLGATATPARVAQAWPTWWSANRSVIGDDPNLIHPGTHLLPPAG